MPIPRPHAGEKESDFMGRCLGDESMTSEFPDRDQRSAVCLKTFREADVKGQGLDLQGDLRLSEADGLAWQVTLVKAGLSRNHNFYPDRVLREAATLFDGRPVYAKSDNEHLQGTKDVTKLVGWVSAPKFIEGDRADSGRIDAQLNLLKGAASLRENLVDAWNRGKRDLVGLSINAIGAGRKTLRNFRRIVVAEAISAVESVDIVVAPSAGGALVNLIEAIKPEDEDMKLRERWLKFIETHAPEAYKKLDPEKADDEALEAAYREAVLAKADAEGRAKAAGAGSAGAGKADANKTDAVADQIRMVEARAQMRERIARCKLPEKAQTRLRADFERRERFTEAEVDAAIAQEGEYLKGLTDSGKPIGLGDSSAIEMRETWGKKIEKMLDDFFDPAKPMMSFTECYREITGDTRVTGQLRDCDPVKLRELAAYFRESLTTGVLNVALGDALNRRLVAEYRDVGQYDVWRQAANVVPASDFRTRHVTRVGGYGDLPVVAQGDPYTEVVSPDDEEATYAVTKRGDIETITFETVKNDDVGVIRRIPVKFARAAKRTLGKFVLDFVRTNPLIYDGLAFFHATHANLGSTALAAAALAAARLRMLKQTEANTGADRIGIGPRNLWVPPDLEEAAVDLFRRNTNNDQTFLNSLTLNVLPVWYWTDITDWAISADTMDIEGIEIAFLDGNEEPELLTQDMPNVGSMFTHDKLSYKRRHIYGGAVVEFRGWDKSVVAG